MKTLLVSVSIVALSATSAFACGMNKSASKHDTMTTASIDAPMSTVDELPTESPADEPISVEVEEADG